MTLPNILAVLLATIFGASGLMKVLALPPARKLAAEVEYSVSSYRMIGLLEVAAALALTAAIFVLAPLGVLAALGLVMLMGAAVGTHLRNGDPVARVLPAAVLAALAGAYVMSAYAM
ncbi:DoxX family protein [Mycobacterium sp. pW049]|uniref:DoxX family protein n=1 Tax=[Mycobacterium] bulgaricum TaxID=3238985 RepID=UPI00351AE1DA